MSYTDLGGGLQVHSTTSTGAGGLVLDANTNELDTRTGPYHQHAADPTVNDDITNTNSNGIVRRGSLWKNTSTGTIWYCQDPTSGEAIWLHLITDQDLRPNFTSTGMTVTNGGYAAYMQDAYANTIEFCNGGQALYIDDSGGHHINIGGSTYAIDVIGECHFDAVSITSPLIINDGTYCINSYFPVIFQNTSNTALIFEIVDTYGCELAFCYSNSVTPSVYLGINTNGGYFFDTSLGQGLTCYYSSGLAIGNDQTTYQNNVFRLTSDGDRILVGSNSSDDSVSLALFSDIDGNTLSICNGIQSIYSTGAVNCNLSGLEFTISDDAAIDNSIVFSFPSLFAQEIDFYNSTTRKMVFGYDGNIGRGIFYADSLGQGVFFFDASGIAIGNTNGTYDGNVFRTTSDGDRVLIGGAVVDDAVSTLQVSLGDFLTSFGYNGTACLVCTDGPGGTGNSIALCDAGTVLNAQDISGNYLTICNGSNALFCEDSNGNDTTLCNGTYSVYANNGINAGTYYCGNTIGVSGTYLGVTTLGGIVTSGTNHLKGSGSTPTGAVGAAAIGTTGSSITITGNDFSFNISLTTGSIALTTGVLATVTFAATYGTAPRAIISPSNGTSAALTGTNMVYLTKSATVITLNSGSVALLPATTYSWDVLIGG